MKKLTKGFLAVFTVVALLCSMALVTNAESTMTPGSDASAKHYTVQLGDTSGVYYYFLRNATPADGPITLRYTVSKVSVALDDGNIGVVASTDGDATYPYESGAYQSVVTTSTMISEGCTYTMVIDQNSDGTLSYSVTYVDFVNSTSGSIELPNSVVNASGAQFFGLYGNCTTVATLTNVSCVDANGNDLGVALSANIGGEGKSKCSITEEAAEDIPTPPEAPAPASDADATRYTVQLGKKDTEGVYYYFLRNATATDGPVTLRYTVDDVIWKWNDSSTIGVIATADQNGATPDYSSPYAFHEFSKAECELEDSGVLLVKGRTYTLVIQRNDDGTVSYAASYTEAGSSTPVEIDLPRTNGNTAADAQYFGLYSTRTVIATLTGVTCVDANGKDLGVALNSGMGGTGIGDCSITAEEANNPTTGDSFAAVLAVAMLAMLGCAAAVIVKKEHSF